MYKKFLTSTILFGTILTASNLTFASNNPFNDVPKDNWAYEAVEQLHKSGIIKGYPNETYRGQQLLTRYEMAQIIAHSLTKTDLSKEDKIVIDKLMVEFADELNNLGVRVDTLEKNTNNIKWNGKIKYKYAQKNHDKGKDKRSNKLELKLTPRAYIGNSNWTANATIKYIMQPEKNSNAKTEVEHIYAKGPLFNTDVEIGRLPIKITQGVIFDKPLTGITSSFGSDVFNTKIYLGRYNEINGDEKDITQSNKDITTDYYGVQFDYIPTDKLLLNAGYVKLSGLDNDSPIKVKNNKANIYYIGTDYEFVNNLRFIGEYVHNTEAINFGNAYFMEFRYKEAKSNIPNSWEIYAGYRNFGKNVTIETAFDDVDTDQKGFVVGTSYILAKNITADIQYFKGKDISTDSNADTFYSKLEFKF